MSRGDWFFLGFLLGIYAAVVAYIIGYWSVAKPLIKSIPGELIKRLGAWAERNRQR